MRELCPSFYWSPEETFIKRNIPELSKNRVVDRQEVTQSWLALKSLLVNLVTLDILDKLVYRIDEMGGRINILGFYR